MRIDEDENEGLDVSAYYGSGERRTGKKGGTGGKGKAKPAPKKAASKGKGEKEKGDATATSSDNGEDEGFKYLIDRSKIVRADFTPIEDPDVTHWSRQMLVKNIVSTYS